MGHEQEAERVQGGGAAAPPASRAVAVLPCNGLDKEAGALAREVALRLARGGGRLICPVLYQRAPSRYEKDLAGADLVVVDGCKTACASKLARERGLRLARRLVVTELLKELGLKSGKAPFVDGARLERLLPAVEAAVLGAGRPGGAEEEERFRAPVDTREFMAGKFVFRVPVSGFWFNENDCWARVEGGTARIGVSDYVQQSASDMVYFEPPEIGRELEQFGDAGSLESTKTALDIISPVSGRVTAVNRELVEAPELINEDPYVRGWAVEVELSDFEADRELLMDCGAYFDYLRGKVEEEYREKYGG